MLIHKISYENFRGDKCTKELYFHISEERADRMLMEDTIFDMGDVKEDGSFDEIQSVRVLTGDRIRNIIKRGRGDQILELFDWFVRNSYGELSDDGETFAQTDELYKAWTQTASYNAFMQELKSDSGIASTFMNGIFPKSWRGEEKSDKQELLDKMKEKLSSPA